MMSRSTRGSSRPGRDKLTNAAWYLRRERERVKWEGERREEGGR
jgi:hypothetical protein